MCDKTDLHDRCGHKNFGMSYSSSTVRATLSGLSAQIVFMQVPGFTVTYQPASLIETFVVSMREQQFTSAFADS
uniref:Protein kinase domain-containing protein n=2 Tax=Parascaris univalens TaxID=6257 RepID=A0A914ZP96_PARUN